MISGLSAFHRLSLLALLAALALALTIGLPAVRLRQSRMLPERAGSSGEGSAEREAQMKRVFLWAKVAQWVAIPIVIVLLNVVHRPEWIAAAIVTIVGLHLYPLAWVFRECGAVLHGDAAGDVVAGNDCICAV